MPALHKLPNLSGTDAVLHLSLLFRETQYNDSTFLFYCLCNRMGGNAKDSGGGELQKVFFIKLNLMFFQ
jgi:hypothetical protein